MECDFCRSCEESIRRAPLASVGIAALGAFVMSKLPVGALLAALLRLAFVLLRPALLIFGILKIAQLCRCCSCAPTAANDSEKSSISEAVS